MYSPTLSILFFLYISNVCSSILNIEELNSIHYSIDIVNVPVLKNQDWSGEIITVTNKHGQEYVCTLPEVKIPENENKKEEDLLDQLVDISELLKPMEAAPCLIKRKDWWSYEFCYGSVIKQYHLEDNKVVGTILILGKYESDYNWRNNSKTKNKLQKFHVQHYVNGTRCDINGEPRRAEVRFHCEEGVGDYIQQVDEPESCRYVIIIATTRVCHHPYLKPNPNRIPHNINCAPALDQDEYTKYQNIQEIKKKKNEIEKLKLLDRGKKADTDLTSANDIANALDNETDEESKWSIKLVTIPLTKKGLFNKDLIHSEAIDDAGDLPEAIDSTSKSSAVVENANIPTGDNQDAENAGAKSFMSENEMIEDEFNQIMNEYIKEKNKHAEEKDEEHAEENDVEHAEEKDEKRVEKKNNKQDSVDFAKEFVDIEKYFELLRSRLKLLLYKEDFISKLFEEVKFNLDEDDQHHEESVDSGDKDTKKSLSNYLTELVDRMEKYRKKMPKAGDIDLENEQEIRETLISASKFLTEMVFDLQEIHKRKVDRLEKYNEYNRNHPVEKLLQIIEKHSSTENIDEDTSLKDGKSTSSLPASSTSTPNPSRNLEDPIDTLDPDTKNQVSEEKIGESGLKKNADQESQNIKSLKERSMEGERNTKLEQSIKERLQKSGLDNYGRKIEVKILNTNYFADDDKDSLSTLSQEETEAFHNMIINILSAGAEELQEKERHQALESNYNFHLEEPDVEFIEENQGLSLSETEEVVSNPASPIDIETKDSEMDQNEAELSQTNDVEDN